MALTEVQVVIYIILIVDAILNVHLSTSNVALQIKKTHKNGGGVAISD